MLMGRTLRTTLDILQTEKVGGGDNQYRRSMKSNYDKKSGLRSFVGRSGTASGVRHGGTTDAGAVCGPATVDTADADDAKSDPAGGDPPTADEKKSTEEETILCPATTPTA
ncbi:hypothetical protein Aduo_009026 [Ancylostoma duodenale]